MPVCHSPAGCAEGRARFFPIAVPAVQRALPLQPVQVVVVSATFLHGPATLSHKPPFWKVKMV